MTVVELSTIESEHILRERMTGLIKTVDAKSMSSIFKEFHQYKTGITGDGILNCFWNEILSAKRDSHWGSDDFVKIGYYTNESVYFTLFFHELSHRILSTFSINATEQHMSYQDEERFCYDFSKKTCEILNLPYSKSVEDFALKFYEVHSHQREGSIDSLREGDIINAYILGYYDRSSPTFFWDQQLKPQLANSF